MATSWRDPATLGLQLDESFESRPSTHRVAEQIAALPVSAPDRPGRLLLIGYGTPFRVSTVTQWGVLWWLTTRPDAHVTVIVYSKPVALLYGRRLREAVKRCGRELDLRIAGHTPESASWELRSGGGLTVCVPASRPRTPADLLLVEDPHQRCAEYVRPLQREQVVTDCRLFLDQHLKPGAPAIVVTQPPRRDELAGVLLDEEGDRWTRIAQ